MLERLMWEAVEKLDFEKAATLRDRLLDLRGGVTTRVANPHRRKGRKRT
jgi:excinuclease ABC subunit B